MGFGQGGFSLWNLLKEVRSGAGADYMVVTLDTLVRLIEAYLD